MEWKPRGEQRIKPHALQGLRNSAKEEAGPEVFLTRRGNAHERGRLIGLCSLTCVFTEEEKKNLFSFIFLFLVFVQIDTRLGQYIGFVNIFGIHFTFLNGEMHGLRINSRTEA